MGIPAVIAAGDGRAARAVYGESKAYLRLHGRTLVARAVSALQRVPEVDEVWVVGNAERLERTLREDATLGQELRKPLTIVPQFRNLYENAWETYRRLLPGAGPAGRDPETPEDEAQWVLYLSADLPFATPQEISSFIERGRDLPCDYALGLVGESAMEPFYPKEPGGPGITMAYFNLREGRFRQNNLHLVRPARLGKRHYVEEMYENRYQKQLGNVLRLAWKIATDEGGGVRVLFYYGLMHLAGLLDRHGLRRLADRVRRLVTLERTERACSALLDTRFRFVSTDVGGCAVDIDNEHDFDCAEARFEEWREAQQRLAERIHGPLPLPETAGGAPPGPRVLPKAPPAEASAESTE
ncbi:MAG: nucleotidyltransferase family protein, partial [Myxococcota bacterium]|nr:nucleotidyltransferase family protein [Myxococcota bacterium]